MNLNKKIIIIAGFVFAVLFGQSFAKHDDEKATNLKVLPKNISGEDLHNVMRQYSRSLGVRCGFCHVSEKIEGQEKPKWDFASDAKPEKNIARDMMRMTETINEKYLGKIKADHKLEQVSCVTCHMGRPTPIISVDSIVKKVDSAKKN